MMHCVNSQKKRFHIVNNMFEWIVYIAVLLLNYKNDDVFHCTSFSLALTHSFNRITHAAYVRNIHDSSIEPSFTSCKYTERVCLSTQNYNNLPKQSITNWRRKKVMYTQARLVCVYTIDSDLFIQMQLQSKYKIRSVFALFPFLPWAVFILSFQ